MSEVTTNVYQCTTCARSITVEVGEEPNTEELSGWEFNRSTPTQGQLRNSCPDCQE